VIPGKRSITKSTSLSGGIPGNSSGKTSGKSLTTRMLLPTNFPSTRYTAGLVEAVMVISTSNGHGEMLTAAILADLGEERN
jgi:hypothetical protein